MGQRGRLASPVVRALGWMRLISRMRPVHRGGHLLVHFGGIARPPRSGGSQPQPVKKSLHLLMVMRENRVGMAIL